MGYICIYMNSAHVFFATCSMHAGVIDRLSGLVITAGQRTFSGQFCYIHVRAITQLCGSFVRTIRLAWAVVGLCTLTAFYSNELYSLCGSNVCSWEIFGLVGSGLVGYEVNMGVHGMIYTQCTKHEVYLKHIWLHVRTTWVDVRPNVSWPDIASE